MLSPDAVWLTIRRGVAQHVRMHAEELRPRLVEHSDRKRLEVVHDGPMPTDRDSWSEIVESFGKLLSAEVADAALFECDFSTSTEVERVAGKVVLLDAYSHLQPGRCVRRRRDHRVGGPAGSVPAR